MTRPIFIDASAFIALANNTDQYHLTASSYFESLRIIKHPLMTSNFVLDESYTRLQQKAGLSIAIDFGDRIQSSKQIKTYTIDKTLERAAWQIFKRDSRHGFSYTDCTSFALMRHLKIQEAFAFDSDFRDFGWTMHPTSG